MDFRASTETPPWRIPGYYPEEAILVDLTLDAPSYEVALELDEAVWSSLEYGQLYAFNGTRIVGGIDLYQPSSFPPIRDIDGHGTHVASSAIGAREGSCPSCRLVMIDGWAHVALEWATARDWIDVISFSQGFVLGVQDPFGDMEMAGAEWRKTGRSLMTSAGNGPPSGIGTSWFDEFAGPPWVFRVGPGIDPGRWNPRPFEVVGSNEKDVASHESFHEYVWARGTSIAAPHVAGFYLSLVHYARVVLEDFDGRDDGALARAASTAIAPARGPLADGVLNATELERLMMLAAHDIDPPIREGNWPPSLDYFWQGYGMIDAESVGLATAILRGEADHPEKPWEDYWHSYDQYVRTAWGGTVSRCQGGFDYTVDYPARVVDCLEDSGWSPTNDAPDVLWPWTG